MVPSPYATTREGCAISSTNCWTLNGCPSIMPPIRSSYSLETQELQMSLFVTALHRLAVLPLSPSVPWPAISTPAKLSAMSANVALFVQTLRNVAVPTSPLPAPRKSDAVSGNVRMYAGSCAAPLRPLHRRRPETIPMWGMWGFLR